MILQHCMCFLICVIANNQALGRSCGRFLPGSQFVAFKVGDFRRRSLSLFVGLRIQRRFELQSVLNNLASESKAHPESEPEPEPEPEPAYIHEPLPEDGEALSALLQRELARRRPNRAFVRSVLRRSHYRLSRELRCRAYAVLLEVDSALVPRLAESAWRVNTVNRAIIEDYLRHLFPSFSDSGSASGRLTPQRRASRACWKTRSGSSTAC